MRGSAATAARKSEHSGHSSIEKPGQEQGKQSTEHQQAYASAEESGQAVVTSPVSLSHVRAATQEMPRPATPIKITGSRASVQARGWGLAAWCAKSWPLKATITLPTVSSRPVRVVISKRRTAAIALNMQVADKSRVAPMSQAG